jgi:hypothetical protein
MTIMEESPVRDVLGRLSLADAVRLECRIAFSKAAQPAWFRAIKWAVMLTLAWTYWRARYFWPSVGGLFVAALSLHVVWRYKTRRWTQAWRGWNDLAATRRFIDARRRRLARAGEARGR